MGATVDALDPQEQTIYEALETHPEGVSVKDLAVETDIPEHALRRALTRLEKARLAKRKPGIPKGPGVKPPFMWSRVEREEEIPEMPTIGQPDTEEDEVPGFPPEEEGQDELPEGQPDVVPEEALQEPEDGRPFVAPPDAPNQGKLSPPAQGLVNVQQKREVLGAEAETARRTGHKVGGTRRVERVDPVLPNFPPEEMGLIGEAFELSLVGSLEDYIRDTFGGGAFIVHPCDQTGNIYRGRVQRVTIGGLPKPRTAAGQKWLERYNRRLDDPEEPNHRKKGEMGTLEVMQMVNEAANRAQQQTLAMLQNLRPSGPDPASLENLRAAHAAELIQVRNDCEKRITDAKAPYEGQIADLKKQIEGLKTELREQKRDLEAAADRKVSEVRQQVEKELSQFKETSKEKIDALTKEFERESKRLEDKFKLEYELKAAKAGPKDIQSQVQQQMIPDLVKMAVAQAKKAAGLEDDSPGTWGDTAKEMLLEVGPDVIKRAADALLSTYEEKMAAQRPAQRPGAAPARRPGLPAPPAPPAGPTPLLLRSRNDAGAAAAPVPALARDRNAPAAAPAAPPPDVAPGVTAPPGTPVILTEEQQAALVAGQPLPPAPPAEGEEPLPGDLSGAAPPPAEAQPQVDPAAQAAELRTTAFFEVIFTEMRIESEAAAVWASEIPQTQWTLEDLYYKLPRKLRKSIEDVEPRQAWESCLDALGLKPEDHPLLGSIHDHMAAHPEARAWLEEFFEAGPWNETEEEPEEEEEEEEDGKPGTQP